MKSGSPEGDAAMVVMTNEVIITYISGVKRNCKLNCFKTKVILLVSRTVQEDQGLRNHKTLILDARTQLSINRPNILTS